MLSEMLELFLDEVLDARHNVGLHVATFCDMGTNNIKAMRMKKATVTEPFFKFRHQEMATIYDPSHLLKCTRNLFHKYDVEFESERVWSVIAKWEHIEKVYKHDKHGMIHTLYKLSDTHPGPVSHFAMKVSLAAQMMSHTVQHEFAAWCLMVRNSVYIHLMFIRK
jgi:hypothetical protein